MTIKKEPFRRYQEGKSADVITIKMNAEERREFEGWKYLLQQSKDSTAFKQLAKIGSQVLQEEKVKAINQVVMNNYRKNKRLGIVDFD